MTMSGRNRARLLGQSVRQPEPRVSPQPGKASSVVCAIPVAWSAAVMAGSSSYITESPMSITRSGSDGEMTRPAGSLIGDGPGSVPGGSGDAAGATAVDAGGAAVTVATAAAVGRVAIKRTAAVAPVAVGAR